MYNLLCPNDEGPAQSVHCIFNMCVMLYLNISIYLAIRLDLSSSSDILESSALGHRNNYIQVSIHYMIK